MRINSFVLHASLMFLPQTAAAVCDTDVPVTLAATGSVIQSGTLTKLDLSWFGLEGSSASPSFYVLTIANTDSVAHDVRLMVEQEATPGDPQIRERCESPCWLQREISLPMTIPAHGTVVKTTRDLFQTDFENGGVVASSSPFKSLIGRLGYIPSSYLDMRFRLLCDHMGSLAARARNATSADLAPYTIANSAKEIQADGLALGPERKSTPYYQATRTPVPLSPGVPPSEGTSEILTGMPTFLFQSELSDPATIYPSNESKFLLELWRLDRGENVVSAVERRPSASFRTNSGIVPFPSGWSSLEPGATYVWRVTANLRSVVASPVHSELRQFSVSSRVRAGSAPGEFQSGQDPLPDAEIAQLDRRIDAMRSTAGSARALTPEERRLFRALLVLLGDDPRVSELMANEIPDLDRLRLDGVTIRLEEVEALASQARAGRRTLVGAEVVR